MANESINGILSTSLEKLRELVDANAIIGTPIQVQEDTTIIPISKVSFGFGSGGSDFPNKSTKELFGGGSGGGVSIQPLAFLVVSKGEVKMIQMTQSNNTADRVVNIVPDLVDKITALFPKKSKKDTKSAE
ncbi:MAG: sporulation protein YtfJ [Ruminococcaceae bacterium]|nr:sporulation protein YtfJ [Oscillospiraceae bacterium]